MKNSLPSKSLQLLLFRIIDYAGLYPPANLPLEEAFRNFVQYQQADDVWMLSRFVVPAKRLPELSRLAGQVFPHEGTLSFSTLGRGGKNAEEFLENLKLDIADVLTFRDAHGTRVAADMFETALPAPELTEFPRALALVTRSADVLNKNGLTVFFEAPFEENWQERAEILIRSLRKIKDKHVGFKLRTGGVTAEAFPTADQVAWAILAARDAGVPFKATAGLHHPIRHYNDSVSAKMHGFLNVFGAGVLASANSLSLEETRSILEDEDPQNFVFDESGFSWKNLSAANGQISRVRHTFTSFGSCSFDDPRDDLRRLGLM
ncbi:MAG: hypothetical protein K8S20_12205 [Chloroflexi bacterium]|nr:hypothetical protein [Chloroflexota bacterium]